MTSRSSRVGRPSWRIVNETSLEFQRAIPHPRNHRHISRKPRRGISLTRFHVNAEMILSILRSTKNLSNSQSHWGDSESQIDYDWLRTYDSYENDCTKQLCVIATRLPWFNRNWIRYLAIKFAKGISVLFINLQVRISLLKRKIALNNLNFTNVSII